MTCNSLCRAAVHARIQEFVNGRDWSSEGM